MVGLFRKNRNSISSQTSRSAQRPVITHHATWVSNGATFFVNPDGVTWSYDKDPISFYDDADTEAALAQLQRAYHLNVSFPNAEKSIMDFYRQMSEEGSEIPDTMVPFYDWKPPLPGF